MSVKGEGIEGFALCDGAFRRAADAVVAVVATAVVVIGSEAVETVEVVSSGSPNLSGEI